MSSKIAFIVEGFQEVRLFEGFRALFNDQIEIIPYPVGRNLHTIPLLNQLYDEIQTDDDVDFIEHFCSYAKKYCSDPNRKEFVKDFNYDELKSKDFSEVYLLFDLENHHPEYKRDIQKLLSFFSNETEQGKLYLSYPMIEATVDIGLCSECKKECTIPKCSNVDYKKIVKTRSKLTEQDVVNPNRFTYSKEMIERNQAAIVSEYFERIKCLHDNKISSREIKSIEPYNIFVKQLDVHGCEADKVTSVSGLVNLITNYFEYSKIEELLNTVN